MLLSSVLNLWVSLSLSFNNFKPQLLCALVESFIVLTVVTERDTVWILHGWWWALFVTYTIIQSIMRSEMCSLHLTHPSVHTWSSAAPGEQSWISCRSRDSNPQPWVTSGFKSNALSIRPTTARCNGGWQTDASKIRVDVNLTLTT